MKKFASPLPVVLLLVLACCVAAGLMEGCSSNQPASGPTAAPATAQATPVTCADSEASTGDFPPVPTVIDKTCAVIPLDVNGKPGQSPTDLYSWLTFFAVNWPADDRSCTADPNVSILTGPQNPTWLTYLSNDEVFVPAPQTPTNWCYAPG